MRLHYKYTTYPLSKELTAKSERVALMTHPIYGIILGSGLVVLAIYFFPSSTAIVTTAMIVGLVGGPLLLRAIRKMKFAQYDAEYEKLLRSAGK